jgi:hypothetical protein
MTAFFRFSNSIRKEVEAETGLSGVKTAPIIGQRWQAVDQETKDELSQEYQEEMVVWKKEFAAYKETDDYKNFQEKKNAKQAKKARKMKDPNAPKRPLTAYFLYVAEVRPDVVEEIGKSDIAAVGKKCGEMWRNLSEEEKSKYIETANELKAEYQEEMNEYKQSAEYAAFQEQKKAAKPAPKKKTIRKNKK